MNYHINRSFINAKSFIAIWANKKSTN